MRRSPQPEEKAFAPTIGANNSVISNLRYLTPVFPVQSRKILPYYEQSISLSGASGVITQYVFSANGLYDPDITSTGHQPLGMDTMMSTYEQYTVTKSKLTARFCGNGIQAAVMSVCLSPDTTSLTLPLVVENGLGVSKVIDGRGTNGTGQRIGSLTLNCDVAKYFARPSAREMVNDVQLSGTAAANPTEQVYFVLNTWGFGSFTDNTAMSIDVAIEYDAIFWEPRKLPSQVKGDTRSIEYLFHKKQQAAKLTAAANEEQKRPL